MSALRRSRSRTAHDAGADAAEAAEAIPTSSSGLSDPSMAEPLPEPQATASVEVMDLEPEAVELAAMLSSIPTSNPAPAQPGVDKSTLPEPQDEHDPHDDRSSSLSELGDASELQSDHPTPQIPAGADINDNDSEAETERLDATPRKLLRTGTAASMTSEQLYERTPSKLVQTTAVDDDESAPASPTPAPLLGPAVPPSSNAGLDALSFLAAEEATSLELAGKKRKRSSAEGASADEPIEGPVRKRSSTVRDSVLNGHNEDVEETTEPMDVEEELDNAEERLSQLAQEEVDLEERQADVAADTVQELATVAKLTKPRKGRRGKRKLDMTAQLMSAETADMDGDDNDEDGDSSLDEEAAKKKKAIDGLAQIEKKFKIFREKLCDEQIAQFEQELEMLKQPNCNHPEYLAMIQCIDERRASKIEVERNLMRHKLACHERQTVANRHQLHSQYLQTIRQLREDALAECNHKMYELQRARRKFGIPEVEYSMRLPEKRSERVRQQAAYNLEVSVLSGIAKYVGFPAAPDIRSARPFEIDDDFQAMKIATRPPPQPIPPYIRSAYTRNTTADEAAAEEQFIEKTPWANPQHPAHQHPHYAIIGASRIPSHTYQTPAGQRRVVDIHAPNGSASTIDALSNPPSSAAGTGMQSNHRHGGESISPVLQMKRNPSDHTQYAETPGSMPRNFAGMARDAYAGNAHVVSSPAADPRHEEHHGARWNPMNGAAPPLPPNVRQIPLTQRSNLGAVSVGSGGALFSR